MGKGKKLSPRPSPAEPARRGRPSHARTLRPSPAPDARSLLHELRVHQLELEMQNEELRAARLETESALARYTELFDFAPIGYATLSRDARIREVNHAGAQLLGLSRARLVGMPFSAALTADDREAFSRLLGRAKDSENKQTCEFALAKSGGRPTYLRVTVTLLENKEPTTLLAFEDIT